MRLRVSALFSGTLIASVLLGVGAANAQTPAPVAGPVTPIEHLVVIFQENISFDHYFGTYPFAMNPEGDPAFYAYPNTPSVNGFGPALLNNNANATNTLNGTGAAAPFRLDRSQSATADQDHDYLAEQMAYHSGLVDLFPKSTGTAGPPPSSTTGATTGLVMGYYDGNTVTAMWNYAQHYAMNDNSYGTTFGPSTPGVLNLVSGTTFPATPSAPTPKVVGTGTLVG